MPNPSTNISLYRRLRNFAARKVQRLLDQCGFIIARKSDYYSPISSVWALEKTVSRWNRPSSLAGVDYDLEGMRKRWLEAVARFGGEFAALPAYAELQKVGYGPGFTAVDALTQYVTIRELKPRRYMEVGSGLSTYYCSLAARANAAEGRPLAIRCIEPYPYPRLYEIPGIEIRKSEVQDVPVSVFEELEAGDVLFIDSSHAAKIDSDVTYLFLEVVPRMKPGVVIHVHDIPFPFNIPFPAERWVFGQTWPMLWNEAMLVQALLCHNSRLRIRQSLPLIRHFDEAFLKQNVPGYETIEQNSNAFSSLWLDVRQ